MPPSRPTTGYAAIQAAYPFLCTASVKPNAIKRFPGEIVPGLLYLGDWDNARDVERLQELNIKTVVCVSRWVGEGCVGKAWFLHIHVCDLHMRSK